MASITIRNLDDSIKAKLRIQAAMHGHSMEEEARELLRSALNERPTPKNGLGSEIHARFQATGGIELEIPSREPMRDPPDFKS